MRSKQFFWGVLTPFTQLVFGLAIYSVASHLLSPGEFGRFAVAMTILATTLPVVSLGAPVILVKHLAGTDETASAPVVRAAAYLTVLMASLLVAAFALIVDQVGGEGLGRWLSPGLAPLVALGAAASALVDLRVAEYQAAFRFRTQCLALAGVALVRLVGVVLCLLAVPMPDHRAAVVGYVCASGLVAIYMSGAEWRPAVRRRAEAFAFARRDLARIGLPITASNALGVLTSQIDTLMAAGLLSPTNIALYAVANRLAQVHERVIGGVTAVALPASAAAARRGTFATYARFSTRVLLPAGGVAVLLSTVLAPAAIELLFGSTYRPAVTAFVVLSLGFLLNYAGNPLSQILYLTHRGHIVVMVQTCQLVVFAILAAYVVPRWHLVGLAGARTATNLIAVAAISVAALVAARRMTHHPPSSDE